MKKLQSTCEEYCNYDKSIDLHNISYYKNKNDTIENLPNLIIYGPVGIGKYTQALQIIKNYSATSLKYERKMSFEHQKETYNFLISDIHLEVDFEMLGCQTKVIWNELYTKYIDILMSKSNKIGIILCKNFQNVHSELHDIFYSYINNNNINSNFKIKFIILTTATSFIYNNILTKCNIISLSRPSKSKYQKLTTKKVNDNNVHNIKNLKMNLNNNEPHILLCDTLIDYIKDYKNIEITVLRDHLYNLLIYNLDIYNCIWYINLKLSVYDNYIKNNNKILIKTISFLKLYNNNYRPIYHLENYFIYLITNIYETE